MLWSIFCQFLCIATFFMCLFYLENHSVPLHQFFYRWSWRYSEGYLIKETICQHLSLFLVQTIFCIYLTVKVVRKIEEHIHVFSDMSSMRTGLQHIYCIVTTCQLVNLLWEPCFNPVLVQDWQLNISARFPYLSGISEISRIIWYIDLSTLNNLTFLILCWKLACPNLLVWMTKHCRPLLCFSGYQLWTGL